MAMGSRRRSPVLPAAAAVFSEAMIEPRNVPCSQLSASVTRGTTVARRPPNRMASIGTPFGSSHSGAITGHWLAGAVKRAFGWAAGRPDRKSTRLNSSHVRISYAVFCLKKKKKKNTSYHIKKKKKKKKTKKHN